MESYLEHYQYKNFDKCCSLLDNYVCLISSLINNNFIEDHDAAFEILADVFQWFSIQYSYFSRDPILYEYKLTSDDKQKIKIYYDTIYNILLEDCKYKIQLLKTEKKTILIRELSHEIGISNQIALEIKNKEYEAELSKLYEKMNLVEKQNEELIEIIYNEEPKRKKKITE